MSQKTLLNLADNEVQQWKSFTLDSKEYCFKHLNAFKHSFTHPQRNETYLLYFTISHHVFTRSIKNSLTPEVDKIYPYPSDERVFDCVRYNLSFHLPNILKTLPEQICYHGGYSRYCSCKITQEDGTQIQYQIVYRVWKSRGKMRLHVESAYPLQKKLSKIKKVNFWVICHNLLRGKKLPQPSR